MQPERADMKHGLGGNPGSRPTDQAPAGLGGSRFDPARGDQALHYARYIRRMCGTTRKKPGVSLGRATMLDLADFLESIAE